MYVCGLNVTQKVVLHSLLLLSTKDHKDPNAVNFSTGGDTRKFIWYEHCTLHKLLKHIFLQD